MDAVKGIGYVVRGCFYSCAGMAAACNDYIRGGCLIQGAQPKAAIQIAARRGQPEIGLTGVSVFLIWLMVFQLSNGVETAQLD